MARNRLGLQGGCFGSLYSGAKRSSGSELLPQLHQAAGWSCNFHVRRFEPGYEREVEREVEMDWRVIPEREWLPVLGIKIF